MPSKCSAFLASLIFFADLVKYLCWVKNFTWISSQSRSLLIFPWSLNSLLSVSEISKKYNKIKFENTDKIENLRAYSPIFIIGLPRSGSTLIETLLSSNKSVVPIGENSIINMGILNQISNKIFVKTLDLENFSLSLDCEKLSNYVCKKIKQIEKLKNKNNIYYLIHSRI